MNIFYLDHDPHVAAQAHCDKHVLKMILESCQLLGNAHHLLAPTTVPIYKPTHLSHPCTKWVIQSSDHYLWLSRLTHSLLLEYTHRYGKRHASYMVWSWLADHLPPLPRTDQPKPPPQVMPAIYHQEDTVQAYRAYYHSKTFLTYKHRVPPEWLRQSPPRSILGAS